VEPPPDFQPPPPPADPLTGLAPIVEEVEAES
jgi:hypothetical protein